MMMLTMLMLMLMLRKVFLLCRLPTTSEPSMQSQCPAPVPKQCPPLPHGVFCPHLYPDLCVP